MNNNNEVSLIKCRQIFSREGRTVAKYYQLEAFDNQRVKEIRFIENNDGEKISISQNALNVYKRINSRASKLIRSQVRK